MSNSNSNSSILLVYTGGTIGMMEDAASGTLMPFDFSHLMDYLPELKRFNFAIDVVSFDDPIDSSDVNVETWQKIAQIIEVNYEHFDGFVVLHGTDTMAFSASALSFMLEGLTKPVIFTGAQLPIGKLRTDGKENLITAIELAAAKRGGESIIQEVAIYFESSLYRGNRTHKYNTENFDAFESANFPALAEAGIHLSYGHENLYRSEIKTLSVKREFDTRVAILKIFPGMREEMIAPFFNNPEIKGLIIETFGSGNVPTLSWLNSLLRSAEARGLVILNISQCNKGFVEQGRYETSMSLREAGVIGGADMTIESAITKMMFLLGQCDKPEDVRERLMIPLRGELTSFSTI